MRDSLGAGGGSAVHPSRRTLLRALPGGLLTAAASLGAAGCSTTGHDSDSPVRLERGTLSGAGITDAAWVLARPKGEEKVPLALALHGMGGHVGSLLGSGLRLDEDLAAIIDGGAAPFAIAGVDGGDTYWHDRDEGTDAGALLTQHLVAEAADHDVDTTRLAFIGWSMGGYGSLLHAGRLGSDRVRAVAATSPALWFSYEDAAEAAFDDEEDYEEHLVMGQQEDLRGIPVRIDCGEDDFFFAATKAYARGFDSRVETHFGPGDHSTEYWEGRTRSQLEWLGRHLTSD